MLYVIFVSAVTTICALLTLAEWLTSAVFRLLLRVLSRGKKCYWSLR